MRRLRAHLHEFPLKGTRRPLAPESPLLIISCCTISLPAISNLSRMPFLKLNLGGSRLDCAWIARRLDCVSCSNISRNNRILLTKCRIASWTIRNLIRILFSREVGRVLTGAPFRSGAGAPIGKTCSLRRQQQLCLQFPDVQMGGEDV